MPPAPKLQVRQLSKLEEFGAVVRLQREIWGFHDIELLPRRLFVVASKIGGQVLGGFDGDKMVAFCLCIPGLKPGGKFYLHGHMLGVLPEYRNSGLGRTLKWKQREYAVENGVALIEWTFDPLELKNAFFNIERLGAIVRRYVHNQYGMTSSHLHGGLPTDRLVAEWWIYAPRVQDALDNRPINRGEVLANIAVPADIAEIRQHDSDRARQIQAGIAAHFDRHFRDGLAVIGFERSTESGTYLLGKWESK
jgi:predicted GNAT superfamily acetyltransferase